MKIHLNITDELYRRVADVAAEENVAIEQLVASALEQWLDRFERLKHRAAQCSREKFLQVIAKVPDVEPPENDLL
jgi:hypothetical protein